MSTSRLLDRLGQASRTAQPLVALATLCASAGAHVGVGSTQGLAAGASHPLGGLDHVLAMVAGGLAYATGFLGATLALHVSGLGLGLTLQRSQIVGPRAVRALGGAVVVAGLILLSG